MHGGNVDNNHTSATCAHPGENHQRTATRINTMGGTLHGMNKTILNAAKCAIVTFKENFISCLATVNRNCLLKLWDDFLPKVELTPNLLQLYQQDSKKSANK
jgi:hypothetical protein